MRTRPRSRRPTAASRCSAIPIASGPRPSSRPRSASRRSPRRTRCCATPSNGPCTTVTARRGSNRVRPGEGGASASPTSTCPKRSTSSCATSAGWAASTRSSRAPRAPTPTCAGEGTVIREPCPKCQGDGRVRAEKTIELHVPAGVADHHYLTMRGAGAAGPRNGPAGDLIAVLDIIEDPRFERHGDDLVFDLPVSFGQAALGAEVQVPTPYGNAALKIQPGTQTGTVYRLRGKGLPRVGEAGRGDLHVRAHVWTPTKLTAEQKALLEQLAQVEGAPPDERAGKKFWEQLRQAFGR